MEPAMVPPSMDLAEYREDVQQIKKDVEEIRMVIYQLLLAPPRLPQALDFPALQQALLPFNGLPLSILQHGGLNGMLNGRKRSVHQMAGELPAPQPVHPTWDGSLLDRFSLETDGSPSSSSSSPLTPASIFPAAAQNPSTPRGQRDVKPARRQQDDYIKLMREQLVVDGVRVDEIQIPVPEALECDPSFVAASEDSIVNSIQKHKILEAMNAQEVQDAMTALCKKLAEKRVFGPRLMAQTTVAGPNHSNYENLPDQGIIYIQHVCRVALKDCFRSEDEFWDVFREAMRKLAARCRRVRHSKRVKDRKESFVAHVEQLTQSPAESNPLAMFSTPQAVDWLALIKARAEQGFPQGFPHDLTNPS